MSVEPELGGYFVSAYPPFAHWSAEASGPFRRVLRRAEPLGRDAGFGIYVHVPFCARRCDYCYYLSYADRASEMERYVSALLREMRLYRDEPALSGVRPSFAYIGGGTPSLLPDALVARLLEGLAGDAGWHGIDEATFECAPRSVTPAKLGILRGAGITRLSLGVQQLDDRVLEANGRIHSVRDVRRAYDAIRAAGFEQVNLDLIVGLVGETARTVERTLDGVVALAPESVTVYQLEIPHNTPLYGALRDGAAERPPSWAVKHRRLAGAFDRLRAAGYTPRSAYTAVRDPRRHRFVYQEAQYHGADLLGLGASSFSYVAGVHQQNLASLAGYVDAVEAGRLPLMRGYVLSAEERFVRELVLQLKLGVVELEPLRRKHDADVPEPLRGELHALEREGLLETGSERLRVTRRGLPRVDRLLPRLFLPRHRPAPRA